MIKYLRHTLAAIEIHDPSLAQFLCWCIPASCPFHRTITVLGYSISIPPLCQLNPLYEELMGLRCRALQSLTQKADIASAALIRENKRVPSS